MYEFRCTSDLAGGGLRKRRTCLLTKQHGYSGASLHNSGESRGTLAHRGLVEFWELFSKFITFRGYRASSIYKDAGYLPRPLKMRSPYLDLKHYLR